MFDAPEDLERDFTPVSLVVIAPFVLLVHPSVPARNVKELIALARSRPGKLSYGSVGAGSTPHLAGELLKVMAKVNIVNVPYKGGAANVSKRGCSIFRTVIRQLCPPP